jgi:outer membrane receptor protein involved in Fe transport
LRIRAGQQQSIRAPNIIELFAPEEGAGLTIYQDPCDAASGLLDTAEEQTFCNAWGAPTGFVQLNGTVSALQNSNPNLEPETADTWTAGLVYQPEALSKNNFAITLDYFNIDIEDAVAPFGGGVDNNITSCFFSLDLNNEFCSNVQRDFIGEILPINSQLTNVSLKSAEGIDIQMDVNFELGFMPGDLSIFFLGTHQIENGFKATDVLPLIDCAGKFGVPCGGEIAGTGSPENRATTQFTWSNNDWRVGLKWRWLDGMEDARIVRLTAFGLDPQPTINTIPADAITTDAYNYFDLFAAWQLNETTTLRLGVDNVTQKEPPLMGDAQIQSNTEPGTYDVIGRTAWFNFNMKF